MPTSASIPRTSSLYPGELRSWTDDLPICKDSGVGFSTNSVYRADGHRQEEHPFEDQYTHLRLNDSIWLYGVFDGHNGDKLAKAALDQISAEILLGDSDSESQTTDEEVKLILRQAFSATENNYLREIDSLLAEKTSLNLEIHGLSSYEAYQQYPAIVNKLKNINTELSCGTTAVVVLIYRQRLYVANVGDSRALLCKTDADGVLRVSQLSQDHVISNEDEILRLSTLGIPVEKLRSGLCLGSQELTRCLGHYLVKGGYKDFEDLACASAEPVIAVPDITGPISLDSSHKFLMLMSSSLYKSLEEATGTQSVNQEIAQMITDQFRSQSTLTGVAQAVVDKVARMHHDVCMSRSSDHNVIGSREDITLLVRNFNYPMPNAISPSGAHANFSLISHILSQPCESASTSQTSSDHTTIGSTSYVDGRKNVFDLSNKVKAYVDFADFYKNVEKSSKLLEDVYNSF